MFTSIPRPAPRRARCLRTLLVALSAVLLAACGSVPVSSLWKLRKLQLDTLEPAALRAAVVHSPGLQLHGQSLLLSVSVSRKVRQPGGSTTTESLEEKLPLQELRGTAERSPLLAYDSLQAVVDGVVAYLPAEYGFGTMVSDDCCLNHWLDTHLDEDAYWKLVEKNYRLSSGELPS